MTIRHAAIDDLDIITLIETASFPKTEAAKKEEIEERLTAIISGCLIIWARFVLLFMVCRQTPLT